MSGGRSSGGPLTYVNVGGRGRYRTADRWCVNRSQTVHGAFDHFIMSPKAQDNGFSCPCCLQLLNLFRSVLAHSWHNGGFERQHLCHFEIPDSLTR
jgi:hypothetical protein